jgi:hypothetical protein
MIRSCLGLVRKVLMVSWLLALAACGGGGTGTPGAPLSSSGASMGGSSPGGSGAATGTYTLSWSAASDPNITGYRIYYSTAPLSAGGAQHLDVAGASSTSVDFVPGNYGIASGATLYAAVTSTGSGGLESPLSSQVSIVVQ